MNRLSVVTVATMFVSLVACAGQPTGESASSGATAVKVAPLNNLYDTVWVHGSDNAVKSLDQVADDLSAYDVVFFGEFHGHSGVHLAQMRLFQALQQRYPAMTLSLEQFERDTQPLVDKYLAGDIGEKAFQEEARGWDNYEQSYRPLVEYAKQHELPVLASNAPKNAVICVGRKGPEIIDNMPMPDRTWVASEIHIEEGAYFDKYMSFISNTSSHRTTQAPEEDPEAAGRCTRIEPDTKKHDSEAENGDNAEEDFEMSEMMKAMVMKSFSGQVVRDDTMAESIAMHLEENPGRKVFHLDGNFHSASHLGTVERLKKRMPELKLAVVNPVAVEDNKVPAWTQEDAASGDYILLTMQTPQMFVCEETQLEFQRKTIKKRMGNECIYEEEPVE